MRFKIGDTVEMCVYVAPKFNLLRSKESDPVPAPEMKTIVGKVQAAFHEGVRVYWENGEITLERDRIENIWPYRPQ